MNQAEKNRLNAIWFPLYRATLAGFCGNPEVISMDAKDLARDAAAIADEAMKQYEAREK